MKNIILSLAALITYSSYSQDPRLFEQTWILHDLIINGQSNVPPINSEVQSIPADFYATPEAFGTSVCDGTSGYGDVIFNGTNEFSFPQGMVWLAGSCSLQINIDYTNLYTYGFWGPAKADPLEYEIIDDNEDRSLIITSLNGDQAIYGTTLLNVQEFKDQSFTLFPNPTKSIINLEYNDEMSIRLIKVNDFLGREVLVESNITNQLNVQKIKSGMYFISIENYKGDIITKRFIKE